MPKKAPSKPRRPAAARCRECGATLAPGSVNLHCLDCLDVAIAEAADPAAGPPESWPEWTDAVLIAAV